MNIWKWLQRENANRPGLPQDEFVAVLEKENIPADISSNIYAYFSEDWSNRRDATLHPDDELYANYRIADEDLVDAIETLAQQCNCNNPSTELIGDMPLSTVRDLARMLATLRLI